ncbi:MAG: hypothetical protein II943_09580 [Victivallales bacterium]|nr:hypothetical protein [Victivallales bacterium]
MLFPEFRIPVKHLSVYALLVAYYIYALYKYFDLNGEYSTVFWYIHGVFHEVGHAVTRWAGETICILAGTIFQLLTPIACGFYFFRSHEKHAVLMTIGWLGFALLDSATYMRDAVEMQLQLVAPFVSSDELIHDWNWLFTHWGILRHANAIGTVVEVLGVMAVVLSLMLIVAASLPWRKPDTEIRQPDS